MANVNLNEPVLYMPMPSGVEIEDRVSFSSEFNAMAGTVLLTLVWLDRECKVEHISWIWKVGLHVFGNSSSVKSV